jgi:hypothetical protein
MLAGDAVIVSGGRKGIAREVYAAGPKLRHPTPARKTRKAPAPVAAEDSTIEIGQVAGPVFGVPLFPIPYSLSPPSE